MEVLRRPEEELWEKARGRGWEGVELWVRWMQERLPPSVKADLRGWLEAEGLIDPNKVVLISTSGLRRWGLRQLGIEPKVFNGGDVRGLLEDIPGVAGLLAGSVGANSLTELMERVFKEGNWLGSRMPHGPYWDHVLVRTGAVGEGLHPLSMARLKGFNLGLFLRLAGVPKGLMPRVVGIDTVNAVWMSPEEAVYYGVPRRVVERLGYGWWFLDKYEGHEGVEGDLIRAGGLMEREWVKALEVLGGLGQLRVGVGKRKMRDRWFGVFSGVSLDGGSCKRSLVLQVFAAIRGHEVPRNLRIPGSLDTRILPGGKAPFRHVGGEGYVWDETDKVAARPYEALGRVSEAFWGQRGQLALVMMGVRGLPAWEVGVMLGVGEEQWQRYMQAIIDHPERWMNHAV